MKNLHILPTDAPSRLLLSGFNTLFLTPPMEFKSSDTYQNIYITSDEKPKNGDYITDGFTIWVWRHAGDYSNCKKIVLATDPILTKDGVQAIDDGFLEWFVNNPSCEEIGVEPDYQELVGDCYKIILPSEESKQETPEETAERMYSEEEAYTIWKAGQEYWKTSGESITFEELIERLKNKK